MADHAAAPDLSQLVRAHEPKLRGLALRFCRNADEASDLVQDTFARALPHVPRLRPDSNVQGWLMRIMTNLYRDKLRHDRRSPEVSFEPKHDVAPVEPPAAPGYPAPECEQVLAAIDKLPPALCQVLKMKVVENLRYREIAERLGIPQNTVGTRLLQARKKLFDILGMDAP